MPVIIRTNHQTYSKTNLQSIRNSWVVNAAHRASVTATSVELHMLLVETPECSGSDELGARRYTQMPRGLETEKWKAHDVFFLGKGEEA